MVSNNNHQSEEFLRVYNNNSPDFTDNSELVDSERSSSSDKSADSQWSNNSDEDPNSYHSEQSIFLDEEFKLGLSDAVNQEPEYRKSHIDSSIPALNDHVENSDHLLMYSYNNIKNKLIEFPNKSNNPFSNSNKDSYFKPTTHVSSENKYTEKNKKTIKSFKDCPEEAYASEPTKKQKIPTPCQPFPTTIPGKKQKIYFTTQVKTRSLFNPDSNHSIGYKANISKASENIKEQKKGICFTGNTPSNDNKPIKNSRPCLPSVSSIPICAIEKNKEYTKTSEVLKHSFTKGKHFLDKHMKKWQAFTTKKKDSPMECFVCCKAGTLYYCHSCCKLTHPNCVLMKRMPNEWVCDECLFEENVAFAERMKNRVRKRKGKEDLKQKLEYIKKYGKVTRTNDGNIIIAMPMSLAENSYFDKYLKDNEKDYGVKKDESCEDEWSFEFE